MVAAASGVDRHFTQLAGVLDRLRHIRPRDVLVRAHPDQPRFSPLKWHDVFL